MRIQRVLPFLVFLIPIVLRAQEVSYWYGGFGERWTTGAPVSHPGPVTLCPDGVSDPNCPRAAGFAQGNFAMNDATFWAFQARHGLNVQGDIENYNTDPGHIGDHADVFYRLNSDGTYGRNVDYFAMPANSQLQTVADTSVMQNGAPFATTKYNSTYSTGTAWQVGTGFTTFAGPRLNNDPVGSQRAYAFFAAESYPGDNGIGGHLLGFTSTSVPSGVRTISNLWSNVWKDATSPNDAEYKINTGQPLRTLYLRNFTPVLAFRGDERIAATPASWGRYFSNIVGWYRDGYFYLVGTTLLSTDIAPDFCTSPAFPTRRISGVIILRIKADPTGANGYGGLYLNAKKPQVEIYRRTTTGGPRSFVPLTSPEQVISFSDDGNTCPGVSNRQSFVGCCANPAAPAAWAYLLPPGFTTNATDLPIPTSTWEEPGESCTRYISFVPIVGGANPVRIVRLRENTGSCGTGEPNYSWEGAGELTHPTPAGYTTNQFYIPFPNIAPHPNSPGSLLGFRHVQSTSPPEAQAQFSFTVVPQLRYSVALRTYYNYYVQAANGGGSTTNASAGSAGTFETFNLIDTNGGSLVSGDPVQLQTSTGHYLVAEGGGGAGTVVNADRTSAGAWETFTIEKMNGTGVIRPSDPVALRTYNGYYVVAEGGGGSIVSADRLNPGAWETFTLQINTTAP